MSYFLTRQQLAAHEAGHLIGLDDKYDSSGTWAGWTDNIMGQATQPPQQRNIGELLRFHGL